MNVNGLKELLALANQNNLFGAGYSDSAGSYDPSSQRFEWAMRQLNRDQQQQQRPDFFGAGNQAQQPGMPAYVRPQQFDMNAQAPQAQMRTNYFANDPMRPQVENFLSKLLGGMPAQPGGVGMK